MFRSLIRSLLRVPLAAKLLVANGVLLVAAAGAGVWLGRSESAAHDPAWLVLVAAIPLAMIAIDGVLVRIALVPIRNLERAAERVSGGEGDVRVHPSAVADRSLRRLIDTFNEMVRSLSRLQVSRDRLSRDLLEAGERDRKALAEDLLAGPAQELSTALLLLRGTIDSSSAPGAAAGESVRRALDELRRIAAALHPPELEEIGLASALRALVRTRLESRGIRTRVKVESAEGTLPPEIRLGAFRLVQEAVEVGARREGVREAALWLRTDGSSLLVHLALAGAGGSAGEPAEGGVTAGGAGDATPEAGGGLRRIAERARLLGGDVRARQNAGDGLALRVRLPLASRDPGGDASAGGRPPEEAARLASRGAGGAHVEPGSSAPGQPDRPVHEHDAHDGVPSREEG